MENNKNILEQIKHKYANLLVTDQEKISTIGSWVSGESPNNAVWDSINETRVILDCPDWSAEILTFREPFDNHCFISIRYKSGELCKMKYLNGVECNLDSISEILEDKEMIKKAHDYEEYHSQMLKPKRFDGDIVITDPAYIMGDLWDKDPDLDVYDGFGFDKVFGDTYIYGSTIYGDWSCTVYDCKNKDPKKIIEEAEQDRDVLNEMPKLGKFCADTGLVCVTYLDRSENIKNFGNHCWTMIPDFHGTVQHYRHNDTIYIVGVSDSGEHNFVSFQTGL